MIFGPYSADVLKQITELLEREGIAHQSKLDEKKLVSAREEYSAKDQDMLSGSRRGFAFDARRFVIEIDDAYDGKLPGHLEKFGIVNSAPEPSAEDFAEDPALQAIMAKRKASEKKQQRLFQIFAFFALIFGLYTCAKENFGNKQTSFQHIQD